MKKSFKLATFLFMLYFFGTHRSCYAADYDEDAPLPKDLEDCDGVYLSYDFISRTKEYPRVKDAAKQSWAFNSTITIMNTGTRVLKDWKIYVGFQHKELLISASNAVLLDGDLPAEVGNGTYFSGSGNAELKTSIETANDLNQIRKEIQLSGTMFGLKPPDVPMPKTIKLSSDGYKCPGPKAKKNSMHVCCKWDPKSKGKVIKTKYVQRQTGDLVISYDVTQAYSNNYMAQVTLENKNPLGRLDHWNVTWEWMRGEFIYTMKGAYTHRTDYSGCLTGEAQKSYNGMDFSKVMNCEKKPIIGDMPREKANDTLVGKIPFCCKNGTVLPEIMDSSQSKSVFTVQVYKLPPDNDNITAIYPPEKWSVYGVLNPEYKCGQPIKVSPTEFPDPSGLQAVTPAIATWQVVCNITKPKKTHNKCCVSFSAYYNTSVIPCDTCACGCGNEGNDDKPITCNKNAHALLLPGDALLVPFVNRTIKAKAWAKIKHYRVPKPLPCGDNCGVSINWHVDADTIGGWTARITLFNWGEVNFENWFTALQFKRSGKGYEKAYSFNGTFLDKLNDTIFLQGLEGLNYLMGETNGSGRGDPRIPGKQQTVISFKKMKSTLNIPKGDGFPTKVIFNGEECAIPTRLPVASGSSYHVNLVEVVFVLVTHLVFVLMGYF